MSIPINVSSTDLEALLERYGQIDLEKTLHELGFDISLEIEHLECQHRNRQGKIVEGKLYQGSERTDKAWLDSPYSSDEVKMFVRADTSYNREIANLSRRACS